MVCDGRKTYSVLKNVHFHPSMGINQVWWQADVPVSLEEMPAHFAHQFWRRKDNNDIKNQAILPLINIHHISTILISHNTVNSQRAVALGKMKYSLSLSSRISFTSWHSWFVILWMQGSKNSPVSCPGKKTQNNCFSSQCTDWFTWQNFVPWKKRY